MISTIFLLWICGIIVDSKIIIVNEIDKYVKIDVANQIIYLNIFYGVKTQNSSSCDNDLNYHIVESTKYGYNLNYVDGCNTDMTITNFVKAKILCVNQLGCHHIQDGNFVSGLQKDRFIVDSGWIMFVNNKRAHVVIHIDR